MSELLRYRYFKYTRRGTAPEPVIGVFIVGIPEKVLKDFVQKIRSPSTDDAIFQILTQDDQPKLKELLGVGLDPNIITRLKKLVGLWSENHIFKTPPKESSIGVGKRRPNKVSTNCANVQIHELPEAWHEQSAHRDQPTRLPYLSILQGSRGCAGPAGSGNATG